MVFGFGRTTHREISAQELAAMLQAETALVIDVREADEFASGHIPGAINMPLSTFQPSRLPDSGGKVIVLSCLGGKRSAMALGKCANARSAVDTHLAGGFGAWQAARLPIAH
ncbi:rhodanese-like domain-containing protein [Novosphingobium sp.]|uniref:rhodanese-like domain-containing protein n=1 Tax=Novosphingobium sp. TaxID=1874826 RepID=UPI001EC40CFD|nr:rhodanese-like domain-containing protein [Novosphingobium sp.]MBK9010989.1 rhodanese-like domain-containing protein [Novosphingobium sp.]